MMRKGLGGIRMVGLRCEYVANPLGVDVPQPRLSWVLESDERGQKQTAYQILVASSEALLDQDRGDLWDSGKVASPKSVHIRYAGAPLASNQACFWKVRAWGRGGMPSEFSEPARFSMALLDPSDWKARWIGRGPASEPRGEIGFLADASDPAAAGVEVDGRSTLLRREFAFDRPIRRARVYACGLGFYELRINGQRVGDRVLAPAKTHYRKQVLYDAYDVTGLVRRGANAVGIMLGNGWYNPARKWWSWRMQWFGSQRAIFQMHVDYEDGTTEIITSDDAWKAATGPILASCVYDGEVYDATQERPVWDQPGYDDSAWTHANVVEAPGGTMISHMMEPIVVTEVISPVSMDRPKPGVWVYDMGQNFAGWVRLRARGPRGTKVILRYAENLADDGMIDPTSNNKALAADTYILKGEGEEVYEPRFTYHGFRYAEVTGYPGKLDLGSLEGCVVHSACRRTGSFECGSELINRIHRATVWSQRSNMVGYPMDCPQRDERLGWLGDAHVTAEEAMLNFHAPLFYRNWLSGIRANQNEETGDIPFISPRPFMPGEPGDVPWSSGYILIVWYHYLHYGDADILAEHLESTKRYVDYLESTAEDHILPKSRYGDWVSVAEGWERGEPLSTTTAYHFYNALLVSKMSRILDREGDADRYARLAADIRAAYNRRFFDPETGQYEGGSQFSNAFPLFLGIVPEEHRPAVVRNLVDDIMVKHGGHLTTGILGTRYMMELLAAEGRTDVAYRLVTQIDYPSWGHMLADRTTLSEHWDDSGSNNHVMLGSVDAWFYRSLAGIGLDQDRPGFEHIIIRPGVPPSLPFVRAEVMTVRGTVASAWDQRGDALTLRISIPANSTATVYVPADSPDHVTESGSPASSAPGVRLLRMDATAAVFAVGSGDYEFRVQR